MDDLPKDPKIAELPPGVESMYSKSMQIRR